MNRVLVAGLAALALAAALPVALGDTCIPTCDVVTAAMRVFAPPASVVQAGSALSWLSTDNNPHTATDLETGCFHTGFGTTVPGSVRFVVDEGGLSTSANGKPAEPCAVAPQPDGSFLLEYICLLHPEMKANVLVVR